MRFSILLRIGIIRSTYAHVPVAKVVGAATWSPHSPPWGAPRSRGLQRSLVWVEQVRRRLLGGRFANICAWRFGHRSTAQDVPRAADYNVPWIQSLELRTPAEASIASPPVFLAFLGHPWYTTGRGGTTVTPEMQRMHSQHGKSLVNTR